MTHADYLQPSRPTILAYTPVVRDELALWRSLALLFAIVAGAGIYLATDALRPLLLVLLGLFALPVLAWWIDTKRRHR